ncbi:MAG: hypothetical protein JSR34_06460 [Proteobacteria bacterium]|nr:hypothetical protein [Pseudomonadota bacterium]
MPALRHNGLSTSTSAAIAEHIIGDPNTAKITFFATEPMTTGDFDPQRDGPETNLPLMVALAEYNIPGFEPIYLVFDGNFLTRVRQPRKAEVDAVLDVAKNSSKAYFSSTRAPFTSGLSPEVAANVLSNLVSFRLDGSSLPAYERLF